MKGAAGVIAGDSASSASNSEDSRSGETSRGTVDGPSRELERTGMREAFGPSESGAVGGMGVAEELELDELGPASCS